jgi:predicted small secreted protein
MIAASSPRALRPWLALTAVLALALTLAGCAAMRSVTSDVASFGEWPAGRAPGSYAFDRLPSQTAQPEASAALEASAVAALAKAGFMPVAPGQQPDVLVQVGQRSSRTVQGLWTDPIWLRGGYGYWRHPPWAYPLGSPWAWHVPATRYEREVAILIRDRASGKPLFEARASNDGSSLGDAQLIGAMFQAALMDFPRLGINPRRVTVVMTE